MNHVEALDLLDAQHLSGTVGNNAYAVTRARLMAEAIRTKHDKRMSWLSSVFVWLIFVNIVGLVILFFVTISQLA